MEYIELGPVPAGEPCAQVGPTTSRARCAVRVFRRMLERVLPIPEGLPVKYVVRSHPHDFGTYREVSVRYSGDDAAAATLRSRSSLRSPCLGPGRAAGTRGPAAAAVELQAVSATAATVGQRIERNLTACPSVCRLMSDTTCCDRPSRSGPDQAIGGTHRGAPFAGLERLRARRCAECLHRPWCVAGAPVYTG
jgi:hypothetical protein